MNYIGRISSLHSLIGHELHRDGEVHGGSMNHLFIFVLFSYHVFIKFFLYPNSLQAWGSNLLTPVPPI